MTQKWLLCLGGILGFLAVAAGAFGAHALKSRLTQEMLSTFEVGVRYQIYHALAIILAVLLSQVVSGAAYPLSGWFFFSGTLIFSGSLYLIVLTGARSIGVVTPIGGLLLLVGWLCLLLGPFIPART